MQEGEDQREVESDHTAGLSGFSLIELLVVIVLLGILAVIVVFAVGGMRDDADESACAAERRQLVTAVEAYFAQSGSGTLADAGGAEGYEQTLVDAGLLRSVSELYDLDASGGFVQEAGSACTV